MSMAIQAVGSGVYGSSQLKSTTFKGKKNEDIGAEAPKKERHFIKAAASTVCPGLGQILDGRFGTGIKQVLSIAGLGILSKVTAAAAVLSKGKVGLILGMAASVASGVGAVAAYIHSIVDAYRGGSKKA